MEKNITALCLFRNDLKRRGIPTDHDHPVRRRKFEAIALKRPMAHREGFDCHTVIPVDNSGIYFLCFHPVSHFICLFKTVDPEINIHLVGL